MARMNSIFQSHLSLNCLVNTQRLRSLFFKYSALPYGAWTSIGTIACSPYLCSSCSSAPLSGRRVFSSFLLTILTLTHLQRLKTLTEFRTMAVAPYPIQCYRQSKWITIQSDELLPGDVVSVGRCRLS